MRRVDARLTDDCWANRDILGAHLADGAVEVRLPDGRFPLAAGCVLGSGQTVRGSGATVLACPDAVTAPLLHVLGSGAGLKDLTLELPSADPGLHDGDQCTAITVGQYLYAAAPDWITDIEIERVTVRRGGRCTANSIAVMGAVARVRLTDVNIRGGGTGVAVHWGAVGGTVATIAGPSYHPNALTISGLAVLSAFEAFYLSSVHDVSVSDVTCHDVEIGFRLLPGDNADHFHERAGASDVSSRITITDCRVGWRGIYGLRVAGWGRSEVDRQIRRLGYRDVLIRNVYLQAGPALHQRHAGRRAGIVVQDADGVTFTGIELRTHTNGVWEAVINGRNATVAQLQQLIG